ncbi:hypothetical protein Bca52824_018587 [Brassica carinata]|uniref:Cysteine/Histidine-rich C1 domain family protein n=1 Tax=Brassica carinata TaxID=52824 RepID=A0A8X7VR67_BRACI|nr:hypothetical protein Bca52824_018587 [Brassica carinata]
MPKKAPLAPPPPPPPPIVGYRQYLNRKYTRMPKKAPLAPPTAPPTAPPAPPPPPGRLKPYSNQSTKREVPKPPPPPPYLNQNPTEKPTCLLSHPTLLHTLSRRSGGNAKSECFSCGEQKCLVQDSTFHHYCTTCDVEFHRGCHKFPRKITHPYHPQHPLTFTSLDHETNFLSDGNIDQSFATTILSNSHALEAADISNPDNYGSVEMTTLSQSDILIYKCTWCGRTIQARWFYHCSICNFCLDLSCSQIIPRVVVPNPKSHHHSLVFYPRPLSIPCDACGLVNVLEPSYACFQCNYMVHQSCIDLPRVIKITRHQHRLFHTPYLQSIVPPCRVCYKTVDNKYGQYSCNHEDCSYVVHSKCATHENIWDGKELEWEPEETNGTGDIAPFEEVSSGMIIHFSHEHVLKLEKFNCLRDAEKQCQACILPINSLDFYSCTQCDFFLHEVCAGLLRKLDHALHVHTLVLDPSPQTRNDHNGCLVCSRKSTGFRYKCSKEKCALINRAQIDVRCILLPEYFTHKAHKHPLFISTSHKKGKIKICCQGCKEICMQSYLQCSLCTFAICYQCATIANEICYKFDKHPLTLCYGEEEVPEGVYWCEVCEKELNPTDNWFYTCNECCVTIHLQCLFGSSAYMKPGFTLYHHDTKMKVFRNGNNTRPFCVQCGQRCPSSVYYKFGWLGGKTYCSLDCFAAKGKPKLLST